MLRKGALLLGILFIILVLSRIQHPDKAYGHAANHIVCSVLATTAPDDLKGAISTHKALAASPTGARDGYPFNGNQPDPYTSRHPTEGFVVNYLVISQPPASTYTATQHFIDSPSLSCSFTISCKNSCDRPMVSGGSVCDDSCNVTLEGGLSCPRYGGSHSYTVKTGGNPVTILWGDGTSSTLAAQPETQSVSHAYTYSGKFDIQTDCGCTKRYHVTCQQGGGMSTPTPLPTASPTPTGVYPCVTPLVCSHPCGCSTSSSTYVSNGCSNPLSNTYTGGNSSGGYGGTASNADGGGGSCPIGWVCCQPPASTDAWFKTKDTPYHEKAPLSNTIPSNATAYNASDTGPCTTVNGTYYCHTINIAGLLSAEGAISLGSGVANFPLWSYGSATYNYMGEFTPDTFIQYMRARKETVTINSTDDVQTNKVNYLNGALTITDIDNNGLQGKAPFVLLVDNGALRFNLSQKFNPSNTAITFIVDGEIMIDSSIDEMNGVFIGNDIDFAYDLAVGQTTNNAIWINGNVISMNDSNCLEKRERSDPTKPTCFFTFDFVNQYLPVWSMFTTRTFSRSSS